jgi:ATP-dependent protease La
MRKEDWLEDFTFEENLVDVIARFKAERHRISGPEPVEGEEEEYIVLASRDTVIFPHMVMPLFIGRDISLRAVDEALTRDVPLLIVAQRDSEVETPKEEDLYTVGTDVSIGRSLRLPDGTTSILAQGVQRVRILEFTQMHPYIRARAVPIVEGKPEGIAVEALMRVVLTLFDRCVELNPNLSEDAYIAAMNVDEPGWLADLVAHVLDLNLEDRQEVLETIDPIERLQKVSLLLGKELDVLELESEIHAQVQQEMEKNQREWLLREQMRAIQAELGELDDLQRDINDLKKRIAEAGLPEEAREKAEREVSRLAAMPAAAPEVAIIRTYLDWVLGLPWHDMTEDNMDIARAAQILDEEHYGLEKAKERILEHIAVRKLAPDKMRQPILCFVGPPGTGKTSMGKSIAKALGRKFVRLSLGGVRDEAEIRGHRRTYIGAMPGRILQTMRTAKSCNPLFMLDEIDKLGVDFRGDPAAALLEVLDPEQNHAFLDHYLDIPYDLSRVMFITTANTLYSIPPALLDRMEIIEFPGYVESEKVEIARRFLIPRQLEAHGLSSYDLEFPKVTVLRIIREYTYEAGVRNLDRAIAKICRKVVRRIAEGKHPPRRITPTMLEKYLGPPQNIYNQAEQEPQVGVATGLSWTEGGGDITLVEAMLMDGKGMLTLTGQLGDVMQESAQAAVSYARAHATDFGYGDVDFDKLDIHIHVPEGAVPKDGPSAGVTILTALVSALTGRPVRPDVAMTGEITLRGRVLPIGGLKEKIIAAHRAGIKRVIIPKKNEKDLIEVPKRTRKGIEIIFVDHVDQVLATALLPKASE